MAEKFPHETTPDVDLEGKNDDSDVNDEEAIKALKEAFDGSVEEDISKGSTGFNQLAEALKDPVKRKKKVVAENEGAVEKSNGEEQPQEESGSEKILRDAFDIRTLGALLALEGEEYFPGHAIKIKKPVAVLKEMQKSNGGEPLRITRSHLEKLLSEKGDVTHFFGIRDRLMELLEEEGVVVLIKEGADFDKVKEENKEQSQEPEVPSVAQKEQVATKTKGRSEEPPYELPFYRKSTKSSLESADQEKKESEENIDENNKEESGSGGSEIKETGFFGKNDVADVGDEEGGGEEQVRDSDSVFPEDGKEQQETSPEPLEWGKSWYELLGVSPNASFEEVKKARKRLAQIYHSDLTGSGDDENMKILNDAVDKYERWVSLREKHTFFNEKKENEKEVHEKEARENIQNSTSLDGLLSFFRDSGDSAFVGSHVHTGSELASLLEGLIKELQNKDQDNLYKRQVYFSTHLIFTRTYGLRDKVDELVKKEHPEIFVDAVTSEDVRDAQSLQELSDLLVEKEPVISRHIDALVGVLVDYVDLPDTEKERIRLIMNELPREFGIRTKVVELAKKEYPSFTDTSPFENRSESLKEKTNPEKLKEKIVQMKEKLGGRIETLSPKVRTAVENALKNYEKLSNPRKLLLSAALSGLGIAARAGARFAVEKAGTEYDKLSTKKKVIYGGALGALGVAAAASPVPLTLAPIMVIGAISGKRVFAGASLFKKLEKTFKDKGDRFATSKAAFGGLFVATGTIGAAVKYIPEIGEWLSEQEWFQSVADRGVEVPVEETDVAEGVFEASTQDKDASISIDTDREHGVKDFKSVDELIAEKVDVGEVAVIEKGGSLWTARGSLIENGTLTKEQANELWANSTVEIDGKEIPIHELGLVHEGDTLSVAYDAEGNPERFVFNAESGVSVGDNEALAEAFERAGTERPDWLREALGEELSNNGEEVVETVQPKITMEDFSEGAADLGWGGDAAGSVSESTVVDPESAVPEVSLEELNGQARREIEKVLGSPGAPDYPQVMQMYSTGEAYKLIHSAEVFEEGSGSARLSEYVQLLSDKSKLTPRPAQSVFGLTIPGEKVSEFVERAHKKIATMAKET